MQNISDESLLKYLIDADLQWFLDNERGGFFTLIDGWVIRIIGDEVIYAKGFKIGKIIAELHYRGVNKVEPELKNLLIVLKKKVREKIFQNTEGDINSVLQRQDQMIRTEFCNSLNGWKQLKTG